MGNKVKDLYQEMKDIYKTSVVDVDKFCEGNNSAGTRVRKAMQVVKQLAQDIRVEVQDQKNKQF